MLKTIIVLPDGTELSSGAGATNAIKSITITEQVNDAQELSLGSTCSNMIELTVISPNGGFSIAEGDEITVYQEDGGNRRKIGIFVAEKPTRASANIFKLTAYDRVSLLDKDLTQWLAALDAWPYTLYALSQMVCQECGVVLANTEIPNGDHNVFEFTASRITGRQLMKWIGEVAGRFCRATQDGEIEFAWYQQVTNHEIGVTSKYDPVISYGSDGNLEITGEGINITSADGDVSIEGEGISVTFDDDGNVNLIIPQTLKSIHYYQNSLKYEDYKVASIQKVQIKNSQDDIGTVYPPDLADGVNTYVISGNPLTAATGAESLVEICQTLYQQLSTVSYTPCTVSIPSSFLFRSGDIVKITDKNGVELSVYVMAIKHSGQRQTIECTGSARRDSVTAFNDLSIQVLDGKVLNLSTTVDGLKVENKDTTGKVASLQLDVDGIGARVGLNELNISQLKIDTRSISAEVQRQTESIEGVSQKLTRVEQTAQQVEIAVRSVEENGVSRVQTETGYTFGTDGLRIQKAGQEMENLLDEKGMTVSRGDTVMLKADKDGVQATDVTVRNYLIVGSHARFEDHDGGRTACFYI